MMTSVVQTIIFSLGTLTLTMGLLILILLAADKLFGKKYSAGCKYVVWALIILRMCIPFSFDTSFISKTTVPEILTIGLHNETDTVISDTDKNVINDSQVSDNGEVNHLDPELSVNDDVAADQDSVFLPDVEIQNNNDRVNGDNTGNISVDITSDKKNGVSVETKSVLTWLFGIWLAIAVVVFVVNITGYLRFTVSVKEKMVPANSAQRELLRDAAADLGLTGGKLPQLYISDFEISPMLLGYFKPKILLPKICIEGNRIKEIISHELIHYRRGDLWIKLACVLAKSLHWFNPFVYIAVKKVVREMELSCDEKLLKNCDKNVRMAYSRSMLAIIERCNIGHSPLTIQFDPQKSAIVERFAGILDDKKKKRGIGIILVVLVVCALSTGVVLWQMEPVPQNSLDSEISTDETNGTSEGESNTAPSDTVKEEIIDVEESSGSFDEDLHESSEERVENTVSEEPSEEPNESLSLTMCTAVWTFDNGGAFGGEGIEYSGLLNSYTEYPAYITYQVPDGITTEDMNIILYPVNPKVSGVPEYKYELESNPNYTPYVIDSESFKTEVGYDAVYKLVSKDHNVNNRNYSIRVDEQYAILIFFYSDNAMNFEESVCRTIVSSVRFTDNADYPSSISNEAIVAMLRDLVRREKLVNEANYLPLDISADEITNSAGDSFLPLADNEIGIKTEDDLIRYTNKLMYNNADLGGSVYTGDIFDECDGKLVNIGQRWMVVDGILYRNTAEVHNTISEEKAPDYNSVDSLSVTINYNTLTVSWDHDGDGEAETFTYTFMEDSLYWHN